MENPRNRIDIKFIKNIDEEKIIKNQSKLSFNGFHKVYVFYSSYKFKTNVMNLEKPIYLGFVILEFSKSLMYETYYDKMQKHYGEDSIQLHYGDTESMVL